MLIIYHYLLDHSVSANSLGGLAGSATYSTARSVLDIPMNAQTVLKFQTKCYHCTWYQVPLCVNRGADSHVPRTGPETRATWRTSVCVDVEFDGNMSLLDVLCVKTETWHVRTVAHVLFVWSYGMCERVSIPYGQR